jgi:crotonobetainyl-CoA:carnitine CoA-transferase CaiB-like acyl-CoA transferase
MESNSSLVNNYEQLLAHPQMEAIGMVKEMSHPTLGKVKCLIAPWKLHGVPKATPEPYVEEGIR